MSLSEPISRASFSLLVDGDLFEWQRFGGMSRYEQEILGRLSEHHGVQLQLLHRRPLQVFAGRRDVHYVPLPHRRGRRHRLRGLAEAVDRWRVTRLRPDVFHPTFTNAEALATRPRNVPMVLTVHDMAYERLRSLYGPQHDAFRALRKRLIREASHVLCVSEFTRQEMLDLIPIPENRTSVVHHGISFRDPNPEGLPKALRGVGEFVLYLGALWRHKNVKRLLRAYAGWEGRHQFRLVLAGGDQRWAADHEALAASLRIDKDLLRLGALDDNELGATLQRATCLVYPSLYEGFGIPVLEAMMCGTLVVAARAASLTEVGGEHAIYVDPEDERSIAAGLSRACEMESQERSSRLIAARSWAQSFTWERAAAETLRIYQQVCSSHDRFS